MCNKIVMAGSPVVLQSAELAIGRSHLALANLLELMNFQLKLRSRSWGSREPLPWRKHQLNLFLTDLVLEWKDNFSKGINDHSFKFGWTMCSSSHNYQTCLLLEKREWMNPLFMENWHMQCIAHDIIYRVFCRVLVIITELFIIDLIWNVNEFKSSLLKCKNSHKKSIVFRQFCTHWSQWKCSH